MKLLRLVLKDWRRFRGELPAIEFHPRLTLIHGPNEAGKSTLFEAIRRVLFERAASGASWAERMVPYGTDGIVPSAVLDFDVAGERLRLAKDVGKKGKAELSRWDGSTWVHIASGGAADAAVWEHLGIDAPSSGKEGREADKWGALQWLLVQQEMRTVPDPKGDPGKQLGVSDTVVSDQFERVRRRAQEELDKRLTGAKREVKKGSDLDVARQDRAKADEEVMPVAFVAGDIAAIEGLRK
jgi:hypothetical protein